MRPPGEGVGEWLALEMPFESGECPPGGTVALELDESIDDHELGHCETKHPYEGFLHFGVLTDEGEISEHGEHHGQECDLKEERVPLEVEEWDIRAHKDSVNLKIPQK